VVPGDEDNGDSPVGDPQQRLQRAVDQGGRHAAAVQQVATVDDDVGLAPQRGRERALEACEEVRATAAPVDPGA
jgi:hypothetical protein